MPVYDPKQLAAKTRKGELAQVYYLYGADVVQVQQLTHQILKKASGGTENMGFTKLDGQSLDIQALEESAQQYSMFSSYNCIWIHDCCVESLTESQRKQLFSLIETLGSATILVFDVTGFDPKNGKRSLQGKTKKWADHVAKYGVVCEAVQRTPAVLAKEMISLAEKQARTLPMDSAEELVQLCMGNTLILRKELEKLCAYTEKGGTITKQIVREMTTPQLESTTFQLAKAVVMQRPRTAMEELDKLYAMQISRTLIVHAIASSFIDLYRASVALHHGKQAQDMKTDFQYALDFVVQNAFRDCRKIPTDRLRACVDVMHTLEQTLNSTVCDERVLLETSIIQMLAIAGGNYASYRTGDYRRGEI